ncbi:hypothetical protein [Microbacterium sp. TNHR37B]|uniref:hypothetical protein n=1 Tax=Microbacterium sp. TNHR37B TaxID=1775956 RepID=UPI00082CE38A|nr:hypothetical protein [Microbacterium sp. TNHR37B]
MSGSEPFIARAREVSRVLRRGRSPHPAGHARRTVGLGASAHVRRSAISLSAERAVADTLAATLPHLSHAHHGIDKLLDLLAELSGRPSRSITTPALRAWLEGFSGASRASRAAAALLARPSA